MNERIKELEKQAWDYAYDHETVKGNIANGGFINMNFSDAFSEKFAELIVRECSRVIVNGGYWSGGPIGPKRQCTPPEIAQMIREHFGVEE